MMVSNMQQVNAVTEGCDCLLMVYFHGFVTPPHTHTHAVQWNCKV